jgi:hypothetical protein
MEAVYFSETLVLAYPTRCRTVPVVSMLLTTATLVRSQVKSCGICGEENGTD